MSARVFEIAVAERVERVYTVRLNPQEHEGYTDEEMLAKAKEGLLSRGEYDRFHDSDANIEQVLGVREVTDDY